MDDLLSGLGGAPAEPRDIFRPALVVGLGLGLILTVALGFFLWIASLGVAHVD